MESTKPEKVLLQHVQQLSEEAVQQLIDFAQFLRQKHATTPTPQDDVGKELTTMNTAQVIHLEEEFENYRQLYPREYE